MALTINTNLSSLIVQRNLNSATTLLNQSIERMTTGYKINHAADNAAGYSIATNWSTQLGSLDVAADNAATGADMLTTLEDTYSLVTSHLQRIRDLTEQAANGTYGSSSLIAIKSEITARLEEIDRIADNCEFNGLYLMNDTVGGAITLQVGLYAADSSQISLDAKLFEDAHAVNLFQTYGDSAGAATLDDIAELCTLANKEDVRSYVIRICSEYQANREEVDKMISEFAFGWDIDRLFKIDKDILRIAIVELAFIKDAPHKVVIDEALELAKKYSTDDSPSFINGILARVVEKYV